MTRSGRRGRRGTKPSRQARGGLRDRFRAWSYLKRATVTLVAAASITAIGWVVTRALDAAWSKRAQEGPYFVRVERGPNAPATILRLGQSRTRVSTDPKEFDRGLFDWTAYSYVVPRARRQLPPPPRGLCRDRRSWARRLGGVDARFTRVEVILEGNASGTLVLDEIRAQVVGRRPPLKGSWLVCSVGGAEASPRRIEVDLDRDPPLVQYLREGDEPVRAPILFTLKKGEVETFFVHAKTTTCDCSWRIFFRLLERGRRHVITVDDDGRPFRTTATNRSAYYVWDRKRWRGEGDASRNSR